METREYIKPKQIAEMFGISTFTAWRWAKAGKFGAFQVGKQWFFVKSMLPGGDKGKDDGETRSQP